MKDILLITPPFTQLNTPYPATAYLKGFLQAKNIECYHIDLGLDVILQLFSESGLEKLFENALATGTNLSENANRILTLKNAYISTIKTVVEFLQGRQATIANRICRRTFLPEASRFNQIDDVDWAFGHMGIQDKAKHIATLYLEDISDFIIECIDEKFGFSRYAERLGRSANSFNELYNSLKSPLSLIDEITTKQLAYNLNKHQPQLVALSVPFPGNLFSAFRCGQYIKQNFPNIKIVMGGGFATTELRDLSDSRVFEFVDYITLDDGELPLELLWKSLQSKSPGKTLKRTFMLENNSVKYHDNAKQDDYKQDDLPAPDYSDLHLDKYISVIEMANPMHSLWSNGRWNKLTLAHGCYWGRCTFCDGSLDYIKRFDANYIKGLVDKIENIIEQTGETGFHFVDEAAPPALLRSLALEIIKRKLNISWWTNIRFEKRFTADVCVLLKKAGCIALSGGLEVASDRLLKLINKGVTVSQVANVTKNLTEAGIMVHAYLMYGFPSQTIQETMDSLEMVKQLFQAGLIQSGFWHQFALTAHSPVGKNPQKFGIEVQLADITFANNDVQFTDKTAIDHNDFSSGLKKALFNFMHGVGFDFDLQDWFEFKVPKAQVKPNYIQKAIETTDFHFNPNLLVVWLGSEPELVEFTKSKKGRSWSMYKLKVHTNTNSQTISVDKNYGDWLVNILPRLSIHNEQKLSLGDLKANFEKQFNDFELFWFSKPIAKLKANGLLSL